MIIRPNGHIIVQQAPLVEGPQSGGIELSDSRAAWPGSFRAGAQLLLGQLLVLGLPCSHMQFLHM